MEDPLGPVANTSDAAILGAPKEQWDEIAEKTRSTYLNDFREVIKIRKTGGYYEIAEGHVIFHTLFGLKRVGQADAATFSDLGGGFGKDKQHVFHANDIVAGLDSKSFTNKDADPASFVVIAPNIGRDANAVYLGSSRCRECDLQSLRKINDELCLDKNAAYFAPDGNWKRIPSAVPQSVQQLSYLFWKDNERVFFNQMPIAGADPRSFKARSPCNCEFCGEDKNRCYWFGYPVPCDCKAHTMADFPPPAILMEIPLGRAVIGAPDPIFFVVAKMPLDELNSAHLFVHPGKLMLDFQCRKRDSEKILDVRVTAEVEAGKFYRLKKHNEDDWCDVTVEPAAMVQGKTYNPEIRIQMPGASKPEMEIEISPGKHTFTALCRDVTRAGIREGSSDVTLELKPGGIYQLDADFIAPSNRCDVRAKLLAP